MKRVLKFAGPIGAARFRMLYALYKTGVQHAINDAGGGKKRSKEDVIREGSIDEMFAEIAAPSYADALAAGTVPEDLKRDFARGRDRAEAEGRGADFPEEPNVIPGLPELFLASLGEGDDAPTLTLGQLTTYKHVIDMVDRAVPTAHPRLARAVTDLLTFLDLAEKPGTAPPAAAAPALAAAPAVPQLAAAPTPAAAPAAAAAAADLD